jgi:hypothetical protein
MAIMNNKRYILIKNCDLSVHTQAWYRDKIGFGFKTEDVSICGDYTVKIAHIFAWYYKKIGMISSKDVEEFNPTLLQKIKIRLGMRLESEFKLDVKKYNL